MLLVCDHAASQFDSLDFEWPRQRELRYLNFLEASSTGLEASRTILEVIYFGRNILGRASGAARHRRQGQRPRLGLMHSEWSRHRTLLKPLTVNASELEVGLPNALRFVPKPLLGATMTGRASQTPQRELDYAQFEPAAGMSLRVLCILWGRRPSVPPNTSSVELDGPIGVSDLSLRTG
jgi:hypothetical protein